MCPLRLHPGTAGDAEKIKSMETEIDMLRKLQRKKGVVQLLDAAIYEPELPEGKKGLKKVVIYEQLAKTI